MSEVVTRDHVIKLFGNTIFLFSPDENVLADTVSVSDHEQSTTYNKDTSMDEEITRTKHQEDDHGSTDPHEQTPIEGLEEDEEEADSSPSSSSKTRKSTSASHLKTPKRPEKILPCPRCESSETKFCYYNNRSTSQPRHFCKKCHRYWTAGGSMRKIPIGSGRRKNRKSSQVMSMMTMVDFNFNNPHSGFPITFRRVNQNRDQRKVYSKGFSSSSSSSSSSNVPKSLKIHDPSEAAKSSIWCTLGYEKKKKEGTINVFKAFEESGRNLDCCSSVLQANPAALSRSLNFQENNA